LKICCDDLLGTNDAPIERYRKNKEDGIPRS